MGFLDKLKLTGKKKQKDDSMMPPPPPAPAEAKGNKDDGADTSLPPLPAESKEMPSPQMPSQSDAGMPEAPATPPPSMSAPQDKPKSPAVPPPPAQGQSGSTNIPPMPPQEPPQQAPQQSQRIEPDAPEKGSMPPPAQRPASRQQIRSAFNDIPPIKVDRKKKAEISDSHVEDLDVDRFVLPGDDGTGNTQMPSHDSMGRQKAPAPTRSQAKPFEGPLYVDVSAYEDVQGSLEKLTKQLQDAAGNLSSISKLNDKEDKEFSKLVKKLEGIQDRILQIDEDLFEKQ